jgi:2-hydroxyglutarate dehydrogenase
VVVGGGIVGLAVAREALRRREKQRVVVLEREQRVGEHQTARNSGVVHAGIYYRPESLKARLCVEGARELYDYCDARGIPAKRCGKLVVATRHHELPRLDELERRARANGVPGIRRLDSHELIAVEPHARGLAALHSPSTGIVDFAAVARSLAADVEAIGGGVWTSCAVEGVSQADDRLRVRHAAGTVEARHAIFCTGGWSDRLAVAAGAPPDPRIVPFRGTYTRLRGERSHLVRSLIYPVPDPALPFLGAHLTRHPNGEVLVGPTALPASTRDARTRRPDPRTIASTVGWPGTWRMARRHWRLGVAETRSAISRRAMARAAARYVPEIEADDLEPAFSGIRAQALARDGTLLDDFLVAETPRALHVRNAPSPAATSALTLARLIVDRVERQSR